MGLIKICGVKEARICDLLVELRVNWIGFVFYPASPRYLTLSQAKNLPDYKRDGLLRVGLFVRPELDVIKRTLETVRLDILQLYTSEEEALMIKRTFNMPVWLAKGIQTYHDLPRHCPVDGMVIEAPHNALDTRPGGNGRTFDWSLSKNWQAPKPWLLAGGLSPDNVQRAIQQSNAPAVDVSSGVESEQGIKDPLLIRNFVKNARKNKN